MPFMNFKPQTQPELEANTLAAPIDILEEKVEIQEEKVELDASTEEDAASTIDFSSIERNIENEILNTSTCESENDL